MREIRTSGATRGEVALRVLPYSTVNETLRVIRRRGRVVLLPVFSFVAQCLHRVYSHRLSGGQVAGKTGDGQ